MPRGDGTGPNGFGPMTGRSAGFCAGFNVPGFLNNFNRGIGRFFGRGRGRGFRNWAGVNYYYPQYNYQQYGTGITPENEVEILKNQSKYMQDSIDAINKRIQELEKQE